MTVRKYIEELQKLDQDRDIWMIHETCVLPPEIPEMTADEGQAYLWGIEEGCYIVIDC